MIRRLSRDFEFGAALLGGPVFWALYAVCGAGPTPDLSWPLRDPTALWLPGLVYPVLEEIVFRGGLQGWLAARIHGDWRRWSLANLLTSVIFAALHLVNDSWLAALAIVFPSLIFGFFRDRYQRVLPGILLHCTYNLGFIWLFPGR